MATILSHIRHKIVTTLNSLDVIYFEDYLTNIPKKITLENFKNEIGNFSYNNGILYGGTSVDEDTNIYNGGINGVSKNTNTIING